MMEVIELAPPSVYEAVTRQMVEAVAEDVRRSRNG